jgi:hypothetical protein
MVSISPFFFCLDTADQDSRIRSVEPPLTPRRVLFQIWQYTMIRREYSSKCQTDATSMVLRIGDNMPERDQRPIRYPGKAWSGIATSSLSATSSAKALTKAIMNPFVIRPRYIPQRSPQSRLLGTDIFFMDVDKQCSRSATYACSSQVSVNFPSCVW